MLFLFFFTQAILCIHAYDNGFDAEMIQKIDSIRYDSYYTGKSASREIGEIEKALYVQTLDYSNNTKNIDTHTQNTDVTTVFELAKEECATLSPHRSHARHAHR